MVGALARNSYGQPHQGSRSIGERVPGRNENPFFRSVPALAHNRTLLPFQHAQVDRLLAISLAYGNVLYCMDNETNGDPAWGAYWARYIRHAARTRGVEVHTTEMWDPWDLGDPMHGHTFDHPDLYTFVDVSQNNHQKGQTHWDNMQRQRSRLAQKPRPMNNVKIYGADTGPYGTDQDGTERFWRNVIGGMASARFHRPASGLGLTPRAQSHIRSARVLADRFPFVRATPDAASRRLLDREPNEAYLTTAGRQHAIYFPNGGAVRLESGGTTGALLDSLARRRAKPLERCHDAERRRRGGARATGGRAVGGARRAGGVVPAAPTFRSSRSRRSRVRSPRGPRSRSPSP